MAGEVRTGAAAGSAGRPAPLMTRSIGVLRCPADPDWALSACNSRPPLDTARQEQDEKNHEHDADAATRSIAPVPAVPPRRERSEEREDQDE